MNRNNKTASYTLLAFLSVFIMGLFFLIPGISDKMKTEKENKIMKDLEEIYTSAIIVDTIEGGLHNDSDNGGKYKRLSKLSGFQVYNSKKNKRYSLLKNYKDGKIVVWYGEKLRYPQKTTKENLSENDSKSLKTEDLFTYDESQGVVITGFSEDGTSSLSSGSVIQIPSSYKGREVTGIADKAFYGKNIMGVVIIPESLSQIGHSAFSNNGEKGNSDNISSPYEGSWQVHKGKWEKISSE